MEIIVFALALLAAVVPIAVSIARLKIRVKLIFRILREMNSGRSQETLEQLIDAEELLVTEQMD